MASPNNDSNKYHREPAQYNGETHKNLDLFHTKPEVDFFLPEGCDPARYKLRRGGGFLLAASELRDSIGHPGHVFPPAPRATGL